MGEQYQNLASNAISVPVSNGKPECILTWVRRDSGGIRLYASRELPGAGWGMRETEGHQVHWHLETTMRSVLVYDADTPAQAIQWVLERWAREDAASAELERTRKAIGYERPGMLVINPSDLTRGAGTSGL